MRPEDILTLLRAQPFVPFRFHLSNGTTYEIRHPEFVMVGRSSLVIGLPRPNAREPVYDRFVTVALLHINQIEPLVSPSQPA